MNINDNIRQLRVDVLKLTRSKFEAETGFNRLTLKEIENKKTKVSEKMRAKLQEAFKELGVIILDQDFKEYTQKQDSLTYEHLLNKRLQNFNRYMVSKYGKNLETIQLKDDSLGGIFSKYATVYGIKKRAGFEDYIGYHVIITYKKIPKIRIKSATVRKLIAVSREQRILIFEKIGGDFENLNLNLSEIDSISPIFIVRTYDDHAT
ncbi:MAG: hypothetical protein K2X69_04830 [Silvanigrellaceae bacterium]|nr:hypothetical protein [Silvanigrellaceae bacterium]